MSIEITTLPGGLRVVTDSIPSMDSVAIGVWAAVGTRHEDMVHNGVAHMVEHMMFKGTKTRTAAQIAEAIEDVGGNVNAYTSRDITAYHVHLLKDHTPLAMDILSDILQHTTMPDDEVERERDVILQEIGMSNDTPDDLVFDLYQETAYPDQALGAPILGRNDIIANMQRDTLQGYVNRCYTPKNLVLSAAGNITHDALVKMAMERFNALPKDQNITTKPANYTGGQSRAEKDLEQSHIVMGFQGISRHDEDYYAAVALSTILGGGMSSRLFQEVREKRGLVYSVFSFHSSYADDGQFAVYAGTGPERLGELIPVVCDELKKIANDVVSDAELKRAKTQMKSGLLMARESMMTRAGQQAKHLIYFDKKLDVAELLHKIDAVTGDDILRLSQRIFATVPTVAALGPLQQLESYESLRARLRA
ncbi:M16 family metallopeptidase [Micavibrio aeruginosavorus]|uniref:Insulinase family protein n=1 Tax=Micavibrio aeruginosavorus (strain ARL-13) TaxID=856793 RepID=G2KT50_MICAA|nr:pitrilysin family protein [Micavibrio aeruginosavorus]AEP10594.1 insulinase family protein [Micavibrio aeruginosavorus ARL-13]